jgi:hypothetical protein
MSSKKVTDLNLYTVSELSASNGNALLIITDLENQETKQISAYLLSQYFALATNARTGSFTGSFLGTASYAVNAGTALTASYVSSVDNTTTIQNIGLSGFGLFKETSGSVHKFKNITAGSNVSLVNNLTDNTIEISSISTETTPGGSEYTIQFNHPLGVFNGDNSLKFYPDPYGINNIMILSGIYSSSYNNAIGFVGTASYANNSLSSSYALSSSNSQTSSYAVTASYVPSQGGVLSSYSVLYYTPETGTGTSWYDTGLAITLTPKSANSRFLINVSLIAANGDAWGNSVGGLFKDSTPLINQFTSINSTRYDAFPSSTTYLDYDGSLTTRTYQIKIKGSEAGSRWYTNYSMDLGNLYNATSSMTILEIAY